MDLSEFSRLHNKNHYARHPWEISRKNVLLKLLAESGLAFPVDRIVDIGGGDAYVINSLVAHGLARAYFVIDTAYTAEVIGQLKTNYNNAPVTYIQDLDSYFEKHRTDKRTLYLCMDVLQHFPDEGIILDHLQTEGNDYFFAVPAFQSVFSNHDVLLGHYRRYTLPQLETLLKNRGFVIKSKGYYFTSLLVFRWIDKLLNKNKNASVDNWSGGTFKSAMINTVLSVDFAVSNALNKLGIRIYGLSCYCLCEK